MIKKELFIQRRFTIYMLINKIKVKYIIRKKLIHNNKIHKEKYILSLTNKTKCKTKKNLLFLIFSDENALQIYLPNQCF